MSDAERYEILKDKEIVVQSSQDSNNESVEDYSSYIDELEKTNSKAKSKVEGIIRDLADKLGILNVSKSSPAIEIDFTFSKNNGLKKSLSRQLDYGGGYADFAKALINFDVVLENAILIEEHTDKYKGKEREDPHLEKVYVLFSAFKDGEFIIPVQLEIKKSSDVGGILYVNVAMTKIEADVLESTSDENTVTHSLVSASTYSIAEIFKNVNTADKHFLKYLPDGFLSEEQIKAKQEALAEDKRRIDAMPDKEQGKKETITPVKNLTKEQKDVVEAGRRIGREVIIADIKLGKKNIDGLWDGKIIYINPNPTSGNPMFTLLKHELTHFTQISEKYEAFSFAVTDSKAFSKWLRDKGFKNSQEYIAKIISDQKKVGKNWDNADGREKARREMVANFVGDVLFAEDGALERFVNALSPDHKRTFGEFIHDFIDWIKSKFGKTDEVAMLERKYAKLFKDAKKVTEKGIVAETNSSQYKLSINFAEDKYFGRQIDKFETLKQGAYITVGEIVEGSPLNKVGIPHSTLYFDVSKILQEMKGRNDAISREVIKEIPNVLNNPIVITEYVDKNGMHSVNVYGNLYIGSSPVVVGVMITQTQKGNIISKIQTVHANRHALNEMTDDNILYLSENKKETKSWFQSLGTQELPLGGNRFGFIRSISQSNAFVNTKSKKNSETDESPYSYTPTKEETIDELLKQYKEGAITEEEFKERIVSGKSKNDPVSVAQMKEESANTTPDIQRRQGKVKGDVVTVLRNGKEEFWKIKETAPRGVLFLLYVLSVK